MAQSVNPSKHPKKGDEATGKYPFAAKATSKTPLFLQEKSRKKQQNDPLFA
ncbi:MAG: hypothetical protein SOW01_06120 [Mediterranea sp.]|nr:hypothetical protein [Mediterranea sp.]